MIYSVYVPSCVVRLQFLLQEALVIASAYMSKGERAKERKRERVRRRKRKSEHESERASEIARIAQVSFTFYTFHLYIVQLNI